jgi:hypothetical protein
LRRLGRTSSIDVGVDLGEEAIEVAARAGTGRLEGRDRVGVGAGHEAADGEDDDVEELHDG